MEILAVKARNKKYTNRVVTLAVEGSYIMNGRKIYTGTVLFKGEIYNGVFDENYQGHPTFQMTKADNPRGNPIHFDVAEDITMV